jgi:hypothetical protein
MKDDQPQPPPTQILDSPETEPLLSPPSSQAGGHARHSMQAAGGQGSRFHMHLLPTVYCTILYAPSICRLKTGNEMGRATRLALALVTLNMILQVGMLRIMDVYGHRDAEASFAGIMEYKEHDHAAAFAKDAYAAFLSPPEREVLEQADRMKPLCTVYVNNSMECRPPSVAFASQWKSLDTNGDGVWTMKEAKAAEKKNFKTKKGRKHGSTVDKTKEGDSWISRRPTLIFSSIANGLKQRSGFLETTQINGTSLYVSEDVKSAEAIPKAYFDYWVGDAMMCTRFDRATCEHVVSKGLFDAALTKAPIAAKSKGISDYTSAVRYCEQMLQEAGGCEAVLPVSFTENHQARRKMCGAVSLHGVGSMTNPADKSEVLPVMETNFSLLEEQKRAVDSMFIFFKILLMYLFYASILQECRELIGTVEFLLRFPGLQMASDPGGFVLEEHEQGDEQKSYRITGISRKHRGILSVIFIARVLIIFILVRFGSWFLLNEGRYIELVMNALALSFITGVDEMMYSFMDSHEIKDDGFEDVETLHYESILPAASTSWIGYLFRKECWGLFLIPLICIIVVVWDAHFTRMPRIEAMNCACLSEGDFCAESMVNQASWWAHYWSHTLPAAMHQIEAMRLQGA